MGGWCSEMQLQFSLPFWMQPCGLQHFAQPGLSAVSSGRQQPVNDHWWQRSPTTTNAPSCTRHADLALVEALNCKAHQYPPVLHLYPYQANLALQQVLVAQVAQVNPLFLLSQDHPVEDNPSKLLVAYWRPVLSQVFRWDWKIHVFPSVFIWIPLGIVGNLFYREIFPSVISGHLETSYTREPLVHTWPWGRSQ